MNVKEYISSGVIESYVLGMASESERKEFEGLCTAYPEIAEARDAFERALEDRLLQDARPAPPQLKSLLEEHLSTGSAVSIAPEPVAERPVRSTNAWKWLAAASIILLAGTIYWVVDTQVKYRSALTANQKLKSELARSEARLGEWRQQADMLTRPGVKMAALKGTAHAPGSFATVYWDTASPSRDVWLLVNNLPQPASDKQYQLWALLNGNPINLGMVEIRQSPLLIKMQHVQQAQAFAITLEPKGGSEQPTMDALYVMGQL